MIYSTDLTVPRWMAAVMIAGCTWGLTQNPWIMGIVFGVVHVIYDALDTISGIGITEEKKDG